MLFTKVAYAGLLWFDYLRLEVAYLSLRKQQLCLCNVQDSKHFCLWWVCFQTMQAHICHSTSVRTVHVQLIAYRNANFHTLLYFNNIFADFYHQYASRSLLYCLVARNLKLSEFFSHMKKSNIHTNEYQNIYIFLNLQYHFRLNTPSYTNSAKVFHFYSRDPCF